MQIIVPFKFIFYLLYVVSFFSLLLLCVCVFPFLSDLLSSEKLIFSLFRIPWLNQVLFSSAKNKSVPLCRLNKECNKVWQKAAKSFVLFILVKQNKQHASPNNIHFLLSNFYFIFFLPPSFSLFFLCSFSKF